ncbi:hypothetical protein H9Q13_10125 [Pontibacter sp. JH31]|uniref:Uncharacterized protein n=1 Tax=Pontibacter aquaedesilientis TaxID=2766980 RepID=A0ABR7XGX6_9BACT|nr:hypothetical protein [Pontibacter aquaedesilientis]MBD1397523.1 hypothetical protein [Pontibacter aquaedesilientis]
MKTISSMAFLLFSLLIFIAYFGLLYEKIVMPQFKNMGTAGFFFWGFFVAILLALDVLIVRQFIKRFRNKKE